MLCLSFIHSFIQSSFNVAHVLVCGAEHTSGRHMDCLSAAAASVFNLVVVVCFSLCTAHSTLTVGMRERERTFLNRLGCCGLSLISVCMPGQSHFAYGLLYATVYSWRIFLRSLFEYYHKIFD